ncbi:MULTISPECIES: hypothetical protein [Gordonia]|jgi:hypothetical protein|nr:MULTISPECIES: hypothetical protein [Gordonia]MDH3006860.1 hypothetical protein [Gordonia alkanivorans]MDH3011773.1 hypothetical protein [Gordonia alkanivorans]MDH3016518.1 hypothetical protein [Gordonia alkanivorans]MDH3020558.1 hypothetical protein [Gordonia alkanivorans]MDH3024539.1 hypothetical protein [Gordonia alkanivorans]
MVALIVGLFAPVGLTVFTVGMDRFQRRMEYPGGNRRRDSLDTASEAGATTPCPDQLPRAEPAVLKLA